MDAEGNVTVEAYAGELTNGALFNVVSFNIWPIVGEDIYTWIYTEPAYTFSGDVMTAVKAPAEDNGAVMPLKASVKSNLRMMHKYANAKYVAKKFSAAVQFAK